MPKGMLRAQTDGVVICRKPRVVWHGKINSNAHRPSVYGGTEVFEDLDTAEVKAGELLPEHFEAIPPLVLEETEPSIRLICTKKLRWSPPGQGEQLFRVGESCVVEEGTPFPVD